MLPTVESATSVVTTSGTARASLAENFDTFLQLLTAQLRNQDPTDPLDSNAFTEQLVQFSQVEQQILTNDNLKALADAQTAGMTASALGFIGRSAIVEGDVALLANGGAVWRYELESPAAETTLVVLDANGREVGRAEGATGAGPHEFAWNGELSNGEQAAEGGYRLVVRAQDDAGQAIEARIGAEHVVSAVETGPDGVRLITPIGARSFDQVFSIRG